MSDDGITLPSAREALSAAIAAANAGSGEGAMVWVAIAAELRAGATKPAVDRLLERARQAMPPEDPTTRLTLHDVEGKVCAAGYVAIRRRDAYGSWWLHTHDRTTCTDVKTDVAADPPTERLTLPQRTSVNPPAYNGTCVHCGFDIHRNGEQPLAWRHDVNEQIVCPVEQPTGDQTAVYTMAAPE